MNRALTTLTMLLVTGLTAGAAIVLAAAGRSDDPRPQPPAAAREADAGPIHVRVVDLQGKGIPGIAVERRRLLEPPRSFPTDAEGHVMIPREVMGDGAFLLARRGREALAWWIAGDVNQVRPAGTRDDPIVMKLLPLDDRVERSVVDGAGKPISGVEIAVTFLMHPTNGMISALPGQDAFIEPTMVDGAGRFAMMWPRGASGGLKALHPRFAGGSILVDPNTRTLLPETLSPAGGIAGRVIDAATGKPVAGAVLSAGLIDIYTQPRAGWGQAMSDDQGRFFIRGLEPGVYNLILEGVTGRANATARAVEGVRVRAGDDATADLAIIEGHPLRGVVVDRETGRPIPAIEVGCYGASRPRSGDEWIRTKTDDQGRFMFHVPPGEQYVYLMDGSENLRLAHRSVVVPEQGEIEPVRLMRWIKRVQNPMMEATKVATPQPIEPAREEVAEVAKAIVPRDEPAVGKAGVKPQAAAAKVRTVTGHVRDPQGQPLAAIRVHVSPDMGLQHIDVPMTDRQGMFILSRLPRRPLKVSLFHSGYQHQEEEVPADRDEVQWTFGLIPDPSTRDQPGPAPGEPLPSELRDRLTFVDLEPRGTDYLSDGPGGNGNDLNRLPRGIHKLGETYFHVGEKMVHLQGRERPELPRSVKGIKVRARGRVLHFLHSTQGGADSDVKLIGAYVIHYTDGSMETAPFAYARDITNWWHRDPGRRLTRARAAWTGLNDVLEKHPRPGLYVRLFDMTWTNPHPDREIASLDVLATGKECDPFLVALTLQRDE